MTAKQFLDANVGKYYDYDGVYRMQCVDIIKKYFVDVIGIPAIRNNAIDYWTNYPTAHFTRIANTASFVPKRGDIAIWGKGVGTYGHISVCEGEGNVNWFVSLDANWPFSDGKTPAKYIRHNYGSFLGVLRPKKDVNFDQAAYNAQQAAIAAQAAAAAAEAARVAEAARLEAERVAKLAAEQAQAEADARAKADAAKAKAEQDKIIADQAKKDAEALAQKQAQKAGWLDAIMLAIKAIYKEYFRKE